MSYKSRRSAYYSRNNSYSRSANAEFAESNGRLSRIRAAALLSVSVKAFDAGCAAAEYRSTEWHHVGKYANRVDYFDTNELAANAAFWQGAAGAYKSAAKRAVLLEIFRRRQAEEKAQRIADFKDMLARRRNCAITLPVRRWPSRVNWEKFCQTKYPRLLNCVSLISWPVAPGDKEGLAAWAFNEEILQEQREFIAWRSRIAQRQNAIIDEEITRIAEAQRDSIKVIFEPGNSNPGLTADKFSVVKIFNGDAFKKCRRAKTAAVLLGANAVLRQNHHWFPAIVTPVQEAAA
jgi:hypothetical protein